MNKTTAYIVLSVVEIDQLFQAAKKAVASTRETEIIALRSAESKSNNFPATRNYKFLPQILILKSDELTEKRRKLSQNKKTITRM